jgi:hypothetical protein
MTDLHQSMTVKSHESYRSLAFGWAANMKCDATPSPSMSGKKRLNERRQTNIRQLTDYKRPFPLFVRSVGQMLECAAAAIAVVRAWRRDALRGGLLQCNESGLRTVHVGLDEFAGKSIGNENTARRPTRDAFATAAQRSDVKSDSCHPSFGP